MSTDLPGGSFPDAWRWPRIPRLGAKNLVKQRDENGCGPACGEMLLRDRGLAFDQDVIAASMQLPTEGFELAARLTTLSQRPWKGGAIYLADEPTWEFIVHLSEVRGTWAALLEPLGPTHPGHWVVIDGVTSDGMVLVRDPVGLAYGLPLVAFLSLWQYTVVVIEDRPR